MINSETNCNGPANVLTVDKLPPNGIKKTALRDVQNQNGSFFNSHPENLSYVGGRPTPEAVKVSGTKRLAPELLSTSPSTLTLSTNAVNEHIVNARRRFDLELGRGKIYNNMDKHTDCPQSRQVCHVQHEVPQRQTQLKESNNTHVPVASLNNLISPTNFAYTVPSVPNYVGKYGNNKQAADIHKVSSELPCSINSESIEERQRTERFIRLQEFLKQCDKSYQRDYIQMLLHLSPADLSGHAVELEKRAIQLTIEEGKEIQRMKALNILEKSSLARNSMGAAQVYPSKK